jgi:oligoribonuclease NrnB/cAMP/cGMP phosphodiesterase (DHH superfamily)
MTIHVLYHSHCFDGFGAHYAAWKRFGDKAQYYAVNYGQKLPEAVQRAKDKDEVYILDFSYSRDVLEELRSRVKTLVVLDHHHTAEKALEGFPGATFDMNQSGAVLAWKYFHSDTEVPQILELIQDGDLWKFERRSTKALRAALPLLKYDVKELDRYVQSWDFFCELIEQGNAILALEDIEIAARVPKLVKEIKLHGLTCGCINVTTLVSRTGEAIVNNPDLNCDMAMMYSIRSDNEVSLSFRSSTSKDIDISLIAQKFNGGGHKRAAGGRCTLKELESILDGTYEAE